ncbi:hypothetical protein PoB_003368600 [Plakobranchus ocellatus]|uniref:Uncharacterized protein n=1 Tax=Plakobranchus ocellatus TaxID=259542 RepID=A0AAV4A7I3_9GAST|nr:hypothetical protein PoB_003368600 [Plakobranchus ocellatus]
MSTLSLTGGDRKALKYPLSPDGDSILRPLSRFSRSVAGLELGTDNSLQISGRVRNSLCHQCPVRKSDTRLDRQRKES